MRHHLSVSAVVLPIVLLLQTCPEESTLTVTGIDACAAKVSLTIVQGTKTKQAEVDVDAAGAARLLFTSDEIDRMMDVTILVRISARKMTAECAERNVVGLEYRFSGRLPAPAAGGAITVAAGGLTRSVSVDVTDLGKVHRGDAPLPTGTRRATDPGARAVVIWPDPAAGAACTATCWEQWINLRLFMTEGGTTTEIRNGAAWSDQTGRPQVFGRFGRDVPPGSTGNCFRVDPIPGAPGSRGIVDAPGYQVDDTGAATVLGIAGLLARRGTFTVRLNFTVRSVLICDAPAPRRVLGYSRWTADQTWMFDRPVGAPGTTYTVTYAVMQPDWNAGTTGLEPDIVVP